ncbi:hypothetical protein B0H11DRAFT_1943132 [Mycena galericulata]|nr:hypothetical protein B0H11DRAFT_1943132 [Mycena galericulata]
MSVHTLLPHFSLVVSSVQKGLDDYDDEYGDCRRSNGQRCGGAQVVAHEAGVRQPRELCRAVVCTALPLLASPAPTRTSTRPPPRPRDQVVMLSTGGGGSADAIVDVVILGESVVSGTSEGALYGGSWRGRLGMMLVRFEDSVTEEESRVEDKAEDGTNEEGGRWRRDGGWGRRLEITYADDRSVLSAQLPPGSKTDGGRVSVCGRRRWGVGEGATCIADVIRSRRAFLCLASPERLAPLVVRAQIFDRDNRPMSTFRRTPAQLRHGGPSCRHLLPLRDPHHILGE